MQSAVRLVVLTCLLPCLLGRKPRSKMEVIYSWKLLDFEFPSEADRQAMIRSGSFIPENMAAIDVDTWGGDGANPRKIFVTSPRFKPGSPVTLSTVGSQQRNGQFLLRPYPDWSWHNGEDNCEGMISVFRIQIDRCGRLWVLDSGNVDIFVNMRRTCQPNILVFNLANDKLMARFWIPDNVLDTNSLLITLAVDIRDSQCHDVYAYAADVIAYKLIVLNAAQDRIWRVSSNYMYPDPLLGFFNVNGVTFNLMDGIFGLALGPIKNNNRRLYFNSFASARQSWVETSVLRNSSLFEEDASAAQTLFHISSVTRQSTATATVMDNAGVLFSGLLSNNSIECWNSRLPFTRDNLHIIAHDSTNLQFITGIKLHDGRLWAVSARLQNYIAGQVPVEEVNYRLLVGNVAALTRGTSCESYVPHHSPHRPGWFSVFHFPFYKGRYYDNTYFEFLIHH